MVSGNTRETATETTAYNCISFSSLNSIHAHSTSALLLKEGDSGAGKRPVSPRAYLAGYGFNLGSFALSSNKFVLSRPQVSPRSRGHIPRRYTARLSRTTRNETHLS